MEEAKQESPYDRVMRNIRERDEKHARLIAEAAKRGIFVIQISARRWQQARLACHNISIDDRFAIPKLQLYGEPGDYMAIMKEVKECVDAMVKRREEYLRGQKTDTGE